MYLCAVTLATVHNSLSNLFMQEFQIGDHYLTLATDNLHSRLRMDNDIITISESPVEGCIDNEIIYHKKTHNIKVRLTIMAGRTVYYHINPRGEFFCTGNISLLKLCGIHLEEEPKVLPEFFMYRYVMPPNTLYKNIYQLIPGSTLTVKCSPTGCFVARQDFFAFPPSHSNLISESEAAYEAEKLIKATLLRLAPRQNNLAVLLSGGLDSSILFKLCQDLYGISDSYSTAYPFEHPDFNLEKTYAFSAAQAFSSSHAYYEMSHKEYLKAFISSTIAAEIPIHHMQSVLFYGLFANGLAHEKQIIINGDGADALWGNTLHYQLYLSNHIPIRLASRLLHHSNLVQPLVSITNKFKKGRNLLSSIQLEKKKKLPLDDPDHILWSDGKYGDGNKDEDWICSNFNIKREDIISFRCKSLDKYQDRPLSDLVTVNHLCGDTTTTNTIWSKIAEAHGHTIYYPFLSDESIALACSLPWELKACRPKYVLTQVACNLKIPDFIINRPKTGLGLKKPFWHARGGPFESLIPLAAKVIEENEIRDMQNKGASQIFWNILTYAIWKRLFIMGEPASALQDELEN